MKYPALIHLRRIAGTVLPGISPSLREQLSEKIMSDCFDHMADAWDDLLFGATHHGFEARNRRDDYFRSLSYRRFPSCNRCGATRLVWFHDGRRYILINPKGNKPHRCDSNKIHAKVADEFEVIE